MTTSYIPSREFELDAWLSNFKTLIAASPTSYGLVAGDATAITTAFNNWHTAYTAAINPTTRTRLTVGTKNEQKGIVLALVRGYAATIRANSAISTALKEGLGLHVRDVEPSPVPPPATFPTLTVTEPMRRFQDINAHDSTTPNRRAKPTGTAGLLLFRAIATEAVAEPEQAEFLAFISRTAYQATFDPADNGKVATYFGRWTNSKGEVGPWGPGVNMPIAA